MIQGQFYGKLVKGTAKIAGRNGKTLAFAELEVIEGEHKGKRFNYEGKLDEKGIKYTKRDLMALGWKGQKSATITADCDAALEGGLVVPFEVEVARWNKPDGGVKEWETIRSIGRAPMKLDELDAQKLADVDGWFADAGPVDGSNSDLPF
jgi:hypothetical protein